jgi:hypothetical protein
LLVLALYIQARSAAIGYVVTRWPQDMPFPLPIDYLGILDALGFDLLMPQVLFPEIG